MFEQAAGFRRRQVQPVLPQVAVFQAAVFADLLAVGHQREQPGIAAHQALPGIQDAVVHALDVGAEVQRIAEQRAALAVDVGLVDTQQGVAEHRRGAVEVGGGEHQHGTVRGDVGVPGGELGAAQRRQVVQRQLLAQPAGARRVDALRVAVAEAGVAIQRLEGGRQFGGRVLGAVGSEEEFVVVDVAAPAPQLAALVVAEGKPERVAGQGLQAGGSELRGGLQHAAGAAHEEGEQKSEHRQPAARETRKCPPRRTPGEGGRPGGCPRRIRPCRRTAPDVRPASARPGWRRAPARR
ncbi:hypothetical protein D3C81_1288140 [compost metagenome]